MDTPSLVFLFFFFFSVAQSSSPAHPTHYTFELIHRDSPRSPLYNPKNTVTDRLNAAFLRSISRSRSFNHQTDLRSGLIGAGGEFYMRITIGTPPKKVDAIADTGSDLIWVQCQPCQKCYDEINPIFEKTKSSTYKNEPCESLNCKALPKGHGGCNESQKVCTYSYNYGDNSSTKGDIATETLSMDSVSGSPVSFPGTAFGCGYNNKGIFHETGSGIIGLGEGRLSLITQLSSSITKKFSYCLSPYSSTTKATSIITLGTNSIPSALSNDSGAISTPLFDLNVNQDPNNYYYLILEAISVGKTKIPYPGAYSETTGNIIIDSGTPLTLLEPGFFEKFFAVVEKSVTGAKPVMIDSWKYCFKAADNVKIGLPEITMHFRRADVRLSQINAFVKMNDTFCLSMSPAAQVAIYGTYAQLDLFVGYDLVTRTVSFQPMDCSAIL